MTHNDTIASLAVNAWINGGLVVWPEADLRWADLFGANLTGADLTVAKITLGNRTFTLNEETE